MDAETCWRCNSTMEWRHGTWQCSRCRFKLGCCEGDPQTNCDTTAKPAWERVDDPDPAP